MGEVRRRVTLKNACPICRSDLINADCANCGLIGKQLWIATDRDGEGPMTIDLDAEIPVIYYKERGSDIERCVLQCHGLPNVICTSIRAGYQERNWRGFAVQVPLPGIPPELLIQRFDHQNAPKIREAVKELRARGNITKEEWDKLYLNSYERIELLPALTDEALIDWTTKMQCNCSRHPSTYDGLVIGHIVPLLLERLKGKR